MLLMSHKKRRLYDRMQYGIKRKEVTTTRTAGFRTSCADTHAVASQAAADVLRAKRKALDVKMKKKPT